jgi:hypothetical protein
MLGLYWRMIREDQLLEEPAAAGVNRTIRIEGIPLRVDNRDVVVVALAHHVRATISTAEVEDQTVPPREAQRMCHGTIQLPGRNSVGLVPTAVPADAIALLNTARGLGNAAMSLFGGVGGVIGGFDVPAQDSIEIESTLILPYAPQALAAAPQGTAGAFDGAIDAALFDLAPPTLSIGAMGQNPNAAITVEEIQGEVWVCIATCEPGECLAPTKPQILLLGDLVNNPQHYGLGNVSDVQEVAILSTDTCGTDTDLDCWTSGAAAALEVDGTEITEAPWRALVRMPLQEGGAGAYWQGLFELGGRLDTAILLTPSTIPKAS